MPAMSCYHQSCLSTILLRSFGRAVPDFVSNICLSLTDIILPSHLQHGTEHPSSLVIILLPKHGSTLRLYRHN